MKEKTVDADNLTPPNEEETRAYGEIRSAEDRQLNANGYTLKVAVYYDEVWKAEFGAEANARVDAIMALVDEQYSESTFAVICIKFLSIPHLMFYNFYRLTLMSKLWLLSMLKVKIGIGNGTQVALGQFCVQGQVVLMVTSQLPPPMMSTFGSS